jgi:hypothetical protein
MAIESVGSTSPSASGLADRAATPIDIPATDQLQQLARFGTPVQQGEALRALDQASTQAAAPEMCTVEVRFKPVALGADHAFIVTTDSNSVNYFRGGPQANNTGLNSPSGSSGGGQNGAEFDSRFGIYGPIVTEYGAYTQGTVDWTTDPSGQQVVDRIAGNCDRIESEFARHMDDIEAAQINYMPLEQNSNSTVRETLERAGYPDVRPVEWAPAWNTQLPMPR